MTISDPLGLLGEVVAEKYVVESVVGVGGFATVYRALHMVWQRPVALKVFNLLGVLGAAHREELIEAFLREGAILAELSERSPAICQARDAGTLTTRMGAALPYLVLEWLDGSTLAEMLEVETARQRTPRTLEEAVLLLAPIAHALALAHQSGIVHRDVKPANIFVVGDPRDPRFALKLLDFGVAKVRSSAEAMAKTAGRFTAFTPPYAAPEQFSRRLGATGPWTDVYALALVLVELATGREAQGGKDIAAVARVACDPDERPSPRTRGARVSDEVEAVFQRALALRTGDRYADAAALWAALHTALAMAPFEAPSKPSSVRLVPTGGALEEAPTLDLPVEAALVTPLRRAGSGPDDRAARWRALGLVALVLVSAVGVVSAHSISLRSGVEPPPAVLPVVQRAPALPPPTPPDRSCPSGMVPIPGGAFFMGDDEGTKAERPAHQVRLGPYCIDRFEVTVSTYLACSNTGQCKRAGLTNAWHDIGAKERATFDPLCNANDPEGRTQHPINCVDWEMASRYCHAQGSRLPTEAEWEFAARGPDGRTYPWGDEPPTATRLNACGTECEAWGKGHGEPERAMYKADDGFATTAPIGSFPAGASRYGVMDIVGNVWEWVGDWFSPYSPGDQDSPTGAREGSEKVIRGGGWNGSEPSWVRPTFRYMTAPTDRSYGTGFRCARSASQ